MTEKEQTSEKKDEEITEKLDELGDAVEAEVVKAEKELGQKEKGSIAVLLDSPQILKDLTSLKLKELDLRSKAELGLARTHKNIIVFYEHASKVGDRFRGLLFILLGLSVVIGGVYATPENLFSLRDFISALTDIWIGRLIIGGIGVCLVAYGISKALHGFWELFKSKEEKEKDYTQKKLT